MRSWFLSLTLFLPLLAYAEIHRPSYQGVDQLLVLSNRWLIVATTNLDEIVQELDAMNEGEYLPTVERWEASRGSDAPDWESKKAMERMRDRGWDSARKRANERALDQRDFYQISSENDEAYESAQEPLRVTRTLVSLGGNRVLGAHDIHYAHYSYLEMPTPLQDGKSYTISLQNGKKVRFLFDPTRTLSRAIKVNQVGYLPDARHKYAYVGCWLQEFGAMALPEPRTFEVRREEDDGVVMSGELELRSQSLTFRAAKGESTGEAQPLMDGEELYQIDLTALRTPGEYYLSVKGVGRSWSFRVGDDVYGEVFYTAARTLYHQRCGSEVGAPYSSWPRQECHTDPVYEGSYIPFFSPYKAPRGYQVFDAVAGSMDKTQRIDDARGGWHDAADWDRNLAHYTCIFDLLYAYGLAPKKFADGQLNIPESGNGIPDILDEVEWGLRPWLKSQDESGGVSGFIETTTHPSIDDPTVDYAFSRRTRWSSLLFAAAAAQYSQLVEPFDSSKAELYREAAKRAYAFGADESNHIEQVTLTLISRRGKGSPYFMEWAEPERELASIFIQAKMRLYFLTGEQEYLNGLFGLSQRAMPAYRWPFTYKDYSPWLLFNLATGDGKRRMPPTVAQPWLRKFDKEGRDLMAYSRRMPYRQSWPPHQDYWMAWGATVQSNQARALMIAALIDARNPEMEEVALYNMDYLLGANPMGISWTTGLGHAYPVDIQHTVSGRDGIADPVPGITIYGVTGGIYQEFQKRIWAIGRDSYQNRANQTIPLFRTWSCHPYLNVGQNEFTIHETVSGVIFTAAMLMNEGWMPSEELINRKPKSEEELYGYWYLP